MAGLWGVPTTAAQEVVLRFAVTEAAGIGREAGVNRRDPSDILRIGQGYYLFYTRLTQDALVYPEGYAGTIYYAASEDEGHTWTEGGEVLGRGAEGAFDAFGVFTPNVVRSLDGRYYLYYTGVGGGFDNQDQTHKNRTAIGVAELRFEEGKRLVGARRLNGGKPVLEPSASASGRFDAFRVDDAALVLRGGAYWLYYKGRGMTGGPAGTRMGVAVAEEPTGPFVKQNEGRAVQPEGHEVLVWRQGAGVFSLVTNVGRGLYYAPDGLHFAKATDDFAGTLNAPGAYRPDLADPGTSGAPRWGVAMVHTADPYLVRWKGTLPALNTAVIPVRSYEDRAAAAGWTAGGTWIDQHEAINRLGQSRQVRLIFLGDSITQSWGGPGRQVWSPASDEWERYYADRHAANFGISGDRTEHLLWRIAHGTFDAVRPGLIVLLIGTNNLSYNTAEETAEGIRRVVEVLRAQVPETRILLLGLFPRGEWAEDTMRVKVRQVNEHIRSLGDLPNVRFVNINAAFLTSEGRLRRDLMREDWLHLRPEGYRAWAAAIEPHLAEMLGQ